MTVSSFVPDVRTLPLGTASVSVAPLTLRGTFALVNLYNQIKGPLGLEASDVELSAESLMALVRQIVSKPVLGPTGELAGPSLAFCEAVGKLLAVTADQVADAPLDHIVAIAQAFWEVNSKGPLGDMVRLTIEKSKPLFAELADVFQAAKQMTILNLSRGFMTEPPSGGTDAGGTTPSSFPSASTSPGASETSSTPASPESSNSSPASATAPDETPPSSEPPTPEQAPPTVTVHPAETPTTPSEDSAPAPTELAEASPAAEA